MHPRVLMLSTDARAGGIQTALALYLDALARLGLPHRLAVPAGAPIAQESARRPLIWHPSPTDWWRFRHGLGGRLAGAVAEADVVITHNNRLIAPARRLSVPVLAVAHGDKRRHLEAADRIVTLSRAFAATLAAGGFAEDRIVALPHALPEAARAFEALGERTGPLVVLAAGRFVEKKGFEDWLEALAQLDVPLTSVRLVLAGDGEHRERLERRAQSLGVAVAFVGWRPIAELLAEADVFCLPSRDEPFGLVLLEAMAAGLACVATRTNGPLDLVADGEDGLLVSIGEPAAMGRAVARLIADGDLRRRLGAAARAKALGPAFTPQRFADELGKALRAAASMRGVAVPSSEP